MNNILAQIEALLFYYGEPIEIKKIAEILKIEETVCLQALNELEKNLVETETRGLLLLRKEKKVQLITKPELKHIGESIIKDEFREQLTPASLETLSLIAYLGPVPRATVDYIRGVNSSFTIRSLVMRGLVERGDEKGASFHYRITERFLKHMGLTSVEQMPEYAKYKDTLKQYEEQLQKPPETPEVHIPSE